MKRPRLLGVLCSYVIVFVSASTNAAIVVPTGLDPGDTYHVIFVTSTATSTTSSVGRQTVCKL